MNDYIRLPRSALGDELWRNNGAMLRVYMFLVKQSENGIADTSMSRIRKATGLTERQVRDALEGLERSNRTSSKRSSKGSSVTICNIEHCVALASSKRSNRTSSKRSNLPLSIKEVLEDTSMPPFVAPEYAETWRRFVAYRKEIKKPYKSLESERIAYNKMVEMADNDPAAAKDMVERTILGQWQGLFPKNNNGTKATPISDNAATRKESRDRLRILACGVLSQSTDKLLSMYDGVYSDSDTRKH